MPIVRKPSRISPRLPHLFWPTILILAGASAFPAALELHAAATSTRDAQPAVSAISQLHHQPIPFLPVHVRPIGVPAPATINPTAGYSSEPAPMGIGDFGVGRGGHPYTYNTTEFLGNFSWQHLNMNNGGDTQFSDQLNVVLQFVQGGETYAYWIQDVAFMDSATNELTFENNIWNFTTGSYCLSNSALSGNGTVYPISGCEGYYAVSPTTQPGGDLIMPNPGDFSLLVRSYLSTGGLPEVAFEYWDGVTSWEVTYDNVVWPWAKSVSADNGFYVDGNATAPSGNFYDAELSIGGPGGGSETIAQSVTNIGSRLFYWNGHNLEAPRSVWNFGADTAETVYNVQSFFSHDRDGTPHTTQLNGTARNATPARAYDQGKVGTLAISAPGISLGNISVNGTSWMFRAGAATLTLFPGLYPVWVNSTSQHDYLGTCSIVSGQTTAVAIPGSCGISVGTPTATPSGVDVGQPVVFKASLINPGSGGDTFNWVSLAAGLNCTSSTSSSISCHPTTAGTYGVSVTVTDSDSQSNTSGTLEFTVDSDPVVGAPTANPTTVETGAAVTFSASASDGTGAYSYAWTGLPGPCSGASSASPDCHPGTSGVYAVSVKVTDSHSFSVTSSRLNYTVTVGPSVTDPVASPAESIDIGATVNLSATASGGLAPYTYSWQSLPAGCSSADLPELPCTPSASGVSSITVSVTDSVGGAVTSGPLAFTVNPEVEIGSVASSAAEIDLGQNVTISALGTSGGSGNYTFVWSGLPPGCTTSNSSSITCRPNVAGTFGPNVTAQDTLGGSATAGTHLTVLLDPSVGGIGASRPSVDVGQTVNFSAQGVSGGAAPFQYRWAGLPTGCFPANSATLTCVPTGTGEFSITVIVVDSHQFSGVSHVPYVVYALPTVAAPAVASGSPVVGQTFDLVSNATFGSGPLSYAWSGLPPGCVSANSSTLACSPTTNGTYSVVVSVRDSNGGSAESAPFLLLVEARPAPAASMEPPYLLIGGLIALAAVAAVAVAIARRRKRAPPAAPE